MNIKDLSQFWLRQDSQAILHQLRFERVKNGLELFDFSMINPDLAPPRLLIDKLVQNSLKPSNHKYAVSRGVKKLRDGFAVKYEQRFGVKTDPGSEVCVTMGCKGAILQILRVICIDKKKVLLGTPTYPAFLSALKLYGIDFDFFEVSDDEDQMLSQIKSKLQKQETSLLLLNFPSNPAGTVVSQSFLYEALKLCRDFNVKAVNDFTYGELCFDGFQPSSLLSFDEFRDISLEVFSMSKAYSIPGWRVAAVLGSEELVNSISRLKQHIDYGIFLPIQYAAAAALGEPNITDSISEVYQRRRNLLVKGLNDLGWSVSLPKAGVSVWAKIPEAWRSEDSSSQASFDIAKQLLKEEGVFALPGTVFGADCDNLMRFALVTKESEITESLNRLARFSPARLE